MDDKQEKEALQPIKSTESWLEFFTSNHKWVIVKLFIPFFNLYYYWFCTFRNYKSIKFASQTDNLRCIWNVI